LTEILSGKEEGKLESKIDRLLLQISENFELSFLPSGAIPPNPSELLNSQSFDDVIQYFSERYDFVIIDCPPALPVTDASIVSTKVDGVIIVVETGKTRKNQFYGVREGITQVGGIVLGAILNKIPYSRTFDEYGYKYGYGYGYRGKYRSYKYSGYKSYKPYASNSERLDRNSDRSSG
jgi:capsular exopolysaccharide synthesis family protein